MKKIIFLLIIGATAAVTFLYSGIMSIKEKAQGTYRKDVSKLMKDARSAMIQ